MKSYIKEIYEFIIRRQFEEKCSSPTTEVIVVRFSDLYPKDDIKIGLEELEKDNKIRIGLKYRWHPVVKEEEEFNPVFVRSEIRGKKIACAVDSFNLKNNKNPTLEEVKSSYYELYGDVDEKELEGYIRKMANKKKFIKRTRAWKYMLA